MRKLLFIMVLFAAVCAYADEKRYTVPLDDSPSLGPADTPVTIIEFLDFQ
ncbi:MAG: hypothetical protein M1497_13305 [Nitrospirae bacterium]|nr:hypothetical protein [Nitrospirota bacterium]